MLGASSPRTCHGFLVQYHCETLCIAGLHLSYGYVWARSDGGTAGSPEGLQCILSC